MHNAIFPVRVDEIIHPRVADESFLKIFIQPRRAITSSPSGEDTGISNQSDIAILLKNYGDADVSFKVMAARRSHAAESQENDASYSEVVASQTLRVGGFMQINLQEEDSNLFSFVMTNYTGKITAASPFDSITGFHGQSNIPVIQSGGVGGTINISSVGVITISSQGRNYTSGTAIIGGGTRITLSTTSSIAPQVLNSKLRVEASSAADLTVWKSSEREGEKGTHLDTFLEDETPKAFYSSSPSPTLRTLTLTGSWQALPGVHASSVDILNTSGVSLSIRYTYDTANTITVPTGSPVRIPLHNSDVQVNGASGNIQLIFQ
jgi:hypothetical protein